jgi:hypothetical protein
MPIAAELILEAMEHHANDNENFTLTPLSLRTLLDFVYQLQKDALLYLSAKRIGRDIRKYFDGAEYTLDA